MTSSPARLMIMTRPMKKRDVESALMKNGCEILSDKGIHTKWTCSCGGKHTANIPRHREISPGVIDDTIKRLKCLEEGWLQ